MVTYCSSFKSAETYYPRSTCRKISTRRPSHLIIVSKLSLLERSQPPRLARPTFATDPLPPRSTARCACTPTDPNRQIAIPHLLPTTSFFHPRALCPFLLRSRLESGLQESYWSDPRACSSSPPIHSTSLPLFVVGPHRRTYRQRIKFFRICFAPLNKCLQVDLGK